LERPYLPSYQLLERHATTAGVWPEWRERALAEIRQRIERARIETRGRYSWERREDDHSRLVEIFLYENDAEAAWQEAQAGGCTDGLWLRLAQAREKTNPQDAVEIYWKQAEAAIAGARNSRYDVPVELLEKAAVLMKEVNRSVEFTRRLTELLAKYKSKRSFIQLVNQRRQGLYLT
jgi:hypothetical protein